MKVILYALVLSAACIQVQGFPWPSLRSEYGDLNMPGFSELNSALNNGELDMAPSLAALPSQANTSLANAIAQFCADLANACTVRGEDEMALSLKTLQRVAPEIAQLAVLYDVEKSAWDMVFGMGNLGRGMLHLRADLDNTMEVMEGPVTMHLKAFMSTINSLPNDPSLKKIKSLAEMIVHDYESAITLVVPDASAFLRLSADYAADVLNYRAAAQEDLQDIIKAFAVLPQDLYIATNELRHLVTVLEEQLIMAAYKGLVTEDDLVNVALSITQVENLTKREISELSHSVYDIFRSSIEINRALNSFSK